MSYPDRRTGANAHILVSGENPDWSIVVEKMGRRSYRTSFYVEQQGFTLAQCEDDVEAEIHCLSIGKMFTVALSKLLMFQASAALRKAAEIADDMEREQKPYRPLHVAAKIRAVLEPHERVGAREKAATKKRRTKKAT